MSEEPNSCQKSTESHSLISLKRLHPDSEAREEEPSDKNETKRLAIAAQEAMDSPKDMSFGIGRGRSRWRPNTDQTDSKIGQNLTISSGQTVWPSPPKKATPSPPHSRNTSRPSTSNGIGAAREGLNEEQKLIQQQGIKEAEERTGLSFDLMNALLNPVLGADTSMAALFGAKHGRPRNTNWYHDIEPKKEEIKEEPENKDKKFQGKQYVNEVQQKERNRAIQSQKEEMERQLNAGASGSQSPMPAPSAQPIYRRHANRQPPNARNISTLSLHTMSTDLESVGTYQVPNVPETIDEDQDMSGLINQYFGTQAPKRAKLPILEYEERILGAIRVNRVVIIEGATGCGKTTQVPQYIADDCASKGLPFNIVVTQPRRIAAKSIAARVAEERNWQLGTIVGYQIGMDRTQVNEDTRICYCTTGVLLQRLINSQKLDYYSHIVVDEVHERSIETDLLLLVIKKLMNMRSHSVKIVLMSATFDPEQLIEYFKIPIYEGEDMVTEVTPTHIRVNEKPHELSVFYMKEMKKDLGVQSVVPDVRFSNPMSIAEKDAPCVSIEAMDVATAILEIGITKIEDPTLANRGSVLVFLPGLEEIHEMKAKLEKSDECKRQQWKIYPLHSSIPLDKQNAIFYKPRGRERKIILATNIAESSITVPDVSYVIDFCLTKSLVCDIETHIPVLRMEWASKANCQQRAGRAGRVSDGRVYRLVDKVFYESLSQYSQPELVRSPLDLSILRVKMLNLGSPKDLLGLALDPPDLSDIYHSVLQLKQVGAFTINTTDQNNESREKQLYYDEEDGDITTLGVIMSHLPIDIRLGKLVVMGHVFDVLEDCIIIAACLSTQGMFRREFSQGLNAYKSRLAWADRSFSDSIAYLNAYKMYKKFNPEFSSDTKMADKWCRQNFVQYKRIKEVDYMVGELMERLRRDNIMIPNRPNLRRNRNEEELILKVVMCAAFYPNYFTRNPIETELIPKLLSNKDPLNSVMISGLPTNEGMLYTQAIRQLFSICAKRIDLHFEETKAYLTFLNERHPLKEAFDLHIPAELKTEDSIHGSQSSLSMSMQSVKSEGRDTPMSLGASSLSSRYSIRMKKDLKETTIKTAVYVAIAMKYHREVSKEIPRLEPKLAKQKLQSLNKFKEEETEKWRSFRSNRVSVPHCLSRIKLNKLDLPALDCAEMSIRITHIDNPTNFYCQYAHKMTEDMIQEMSNIISYSETYKFHPEMAQIGDYVIAAYLDNSRSQMYGRARIDNIEYKHPTKEVDRVQIFFIDFGFTQIVEDFSKLSQINARVDQRLIEIPPLAFKCSLSCVNPSPIACFDSSWSKKSIDYFKAFAFPKSDESSQKKNEKLFTAKIFSVVNRVVRLELYNVVQRDESFNDLLVSIGYAYKSEETLQSRLNHEHRRRELQNSRPTDSALRLERQDQKGVYNPDDVIELEIEFNPLERNQMIRSHDKFTIKGPESPLECKFTGLSRQQSNRAARIERDSVNCVVLEPDYLSRHTRLLVASSVGLSQASGNIALRNTTLMPNIRGFPAIMALLFAPRVQLRADKERHQYIGAICGIGYNKSSLKAYDPEYDIEIPFDADITRDDMIKINVIRYHISSLLKSSEELRDFTEGSLVIKQRTIRRNVIELLDRRRRVVDTDQYYPSYRWSDITVNDVNSGLNKTEAELNAELLPLCEQIALQKYDWFNDVKENLEQLKLVQSGSKSTPTKCKLCKFTSYTSQDIRSHLLGYEHMDAVSDFSKNLKIEKNERHKLEHFKRQAEDGIDEEDAQIFDLDSDDD